MMTTIDKIEQIVTDSAMIQHGMTLEKIRKVSNPVDGDKLFCTMCRKDEKYVVSLYNLEDNSFNYSHDTTDFDFANQIFDFIFGYSTK
jgi:hypothetical protein